VGAVVLETQRLTLREIDAGDAPFILELVNDPDWIRFIGDRGVRTLEDARGYIERGPRSLYAKLGFGLWLVLLKDGDTFCVGQIEFKAMHTPGHTPEHVCFSRRS